MSALEGGGMDDNAAFERLEDEFARAAEAGDADYEDMQDMHRAGGPEDQGAHADALGDLEGLNEEDLLMSERFAGYSDYFDAIPIGDRLYMKGQETLRRKHENVLKAQHMQHENEKKGQQKKPQISELGAKVVRSGGDPERFAQLQMEWLRKRNRRVEQKKDQVDSERAEGIIPVKVNRRSEKIVAGRHQGPIEAWDERERHFRASHSSQKTAPATFHPIVSPAAQALKRTGNVSERLYKKAAERAKAPPPKKAGGKRITDEEFDSLLKHMKVHKDAAVRKFENKKKNLQSEEGPYQPDLCPRSKTILRRQGGHVPIHLRDSVASVPPPKAQPERKRKDVDPEQIEPFGLVSKIPQQKLKVQRRLEGLRAERETDLKEVCTFQPKFNKRSLAMASRREGSIRYHQGQSPEEEPRDLETEGDEYYGAEEEFVPGGYDPTGEAHMPNQSFQYVGGMEPTPRGGSVHTPQTWSPPRYPNAAHTPTPAQPGHDLPPDAPLAEWEVAWMSQQRDIERLLQQYTSTTQRNVQSTHGEMGGGLPLPEPSPVTPRTHQSAASNARPLQYSPSHSVAAQQGMYASSAAPSHGTHPTHPQPPPAHYDPAQASPAAAVPSPESLAHSAVSDLQTVLDGWRQLEDQFSHSFEKLRLR
eukprot:TRINITY_DN6523_c0_g1_i2.p1 TRINITY_DN6523_c0_g1~~TRINITY_DN6523_c0_g1_i2.p1  ORF type:complete len:645 (+),score=282.21 TRINITY_DN6523_c0_g1_i2:85-2019(+)